MREQPSVYVAYTTAPGQPASDDGEKGGPYAAALAAELSKPGLDHLSLFQNVKEAVYTATKGAQQPWAIDGLVKRVYLTGQPPAPQAAKLPPVLQPQSSGAGGHNQLSLQMFPKLDAATKGILGKWHFVQVCTLFTFEGDIEIQQKAEGELAVDFGRAGDYGSNVTISDQKISFTRRCSDFAGNHIQHWRGAIANKSKMRGENDNNIWPATCSFTAMKR